MFISVSSVVFPMLFVKSKFLEQTLSWGQLHWYHCGLAACLAVVAGDQDAPWMLLVGLPRYNSIAVQGADYFRCW